MEQNQDRAMYRTGIRLLLVLWILGGVRFAPVVTYAQGADPQPPASIPLPAGANAWQLIFNDNFDGTAYDTASWNPYADWSGNNSFNNGREKYYASQIRVADGICNLVAEPEPGATEFTGSYRSGELISARANTSPLTPYKYDFLYGYIEARLKIVNVSGFFGAFWMIPSKTNYRYEWEIDILEVLGHDHRTMFQTYHYREGLPYDQARNDHWTPNRGIGNNGAAPVLNYSTDYHTYGVDWQPDHLTFYVDGIASGTFPNPGTNNSNIPRTRGYVLIQQMVENDWIRATGNLLPDPNSSVDTFHVDYVRVWQGVDSSSIGKVGLLPEPAKQGLTVFQNPLTERTVFKSINGNQPMVIDIFNGQGDLVRCLDREPLVWDGADHQGCPLAAGLYFYRARYNGQLYGGKLLLRK